MGEGKEEGRKEKKTHETCRAIGENTPGVHLSHLNEALSSGPSYLSCSFTHTVEWTRLTVLSDRGTNPATGGGAPDLSGIELTPLELAELYGQVTSRRGCSLAEPA